MKISGPDQIIRLILEMNEKRINTIDQEQSERIEAISKEIVKITEQKDDVILSSRGILKTEVQFNRGSDESPEAYLHRISNEIITQKELLKNDNLRGFQKENLNNSIVDQALISGLIKNLFENRSNTDNDTSTEAIENKSLKMMIVFVFISILIYLVFIK